MPAVAPSRRSRRHWQSLHIAARVHWQPEVQAWSQRRRCGLLSFRDSTFSSGYSDDPQLRVAPGLGAYALYS
jgi:hypothetical protein